jgi:hypothetical protein
MLFSVGPMKSMATRRPTQSMGFLRRDRFFCKRLILMHASFLVSGVPTFGLDTLLSMSVVYDG